MLSNSAEKILTSTERFSKKGTLVSGVSTLLTSALSRDPAVALFSKLTALFGTTRALSALGKKSLQK